MSDGTGWRHLADRNRGVEFIDACLRGASQVMLQNNPVTGLLILIAVAWGSIQTGHPRVLIGALVALVVGTVTAIILGADAGSLRSGLFGFSPLLTGAGVSTFMENGPLTWLLLTVGAAATTVVTLALTTVLNTWGVPALTFPFVLTTWVLLMAAYQFSRPALDLPNLPTLPGQPTAESFRFTGNATSTFLEGVSQVFLLESWVAGLIILIALAVSSRWSAAFAALGAVVGTLLAIWFEIAADAVDAGLWGFNAVLTAAALGAVLYKPTVPTAAYALFGIVFTVFLQAALTTMLSPIGVPTLTTPFVIATWLFLLPKRRLTLVPQHERHGRGLLMALRPDAGKSG